MRRLSARQRAALADSIFEAVDDPQVQDDLLAQLTALFGANMVAFGLLSAGPRSAGGPPWVPEVVGAHGMSREVLRAFSEQWLVRDGTTLPSLRDLLRSGAPTAVHVRQDYLSDRTYEHSDFYHGFTRPHDQYHYGWTIGQLDRGQAWWALNVCRPQRDGALGPQDRSLLRWLAPQLQRAQRLRLRLSELERSSGGRADALDALPQPCLAVRADGHLLWANRAADALLQRGDGLRVQAGRLRSTLPWQTAPLLDLVRSCAARGPSHLDLLRPPVRPLRATLLPSFAGARRLSAHVATVIVLSDPEASPDLSEGRLVVALHCTEAEGRVARLLAEGLSLPQIAGRLNIRVGTVRNHLRQLYSKTGTHRQADLVRLVLSLPTFG